MNLREIGLPITARGHNNEQSRERAAKRVMTLWNSYGLQELLGDPIQSNVFERMTALCERSKFFEDEVRSIEYALTVIECDVADGGAPYSPDERRAVILGTLFSDISKTGPATATLSQQQDILSIYKIQGADNQLTIEQFLDSHVKTQAATIRQTLHELGITDTATRTMEQFYDLHSQWTYDILKELPLPPVVIRAAAQHHRLKNTQLVAELSDAPFDRAAQLVNLIDVYDALRQRSQLFHEQAMKILYDKYIETNQHQSYYVGVKHLYDMINHRFGRLADRHTAQAA